MGKSRLEAFSDGVLAIIITIMVLELHAPHGAGLDTLAGLWPKFLNYVLSFIYLGLYWNNHHHMLQTIHRVSGGILWANLHLLFWLSLFPFVTGWMGTHYMASIPTALYGVVLFLAAIAYFILQGMIIAHEGKHSILARAVGRDTRRTVSLSLYAAGIALAFFWTWAAQALYLGVALIWLVPDRRIERAMPAEAPEK
jgi:uncharacterized membrane protein